MATYIPQLAAEKSFSNQPNTPNEPSRLMASRSFVRKQQSPQQRNRDNACTTTLFVSSARVKMPHLLDEMNSTNTNGQSQSQNEPLLTMMMDNDEFNMNQDLIIDLDHMALSKFWNFVLCF